jgi:hypothetical protein
MRFFQFLKPSLTNLIHDLIQPGYRRDVKVREFFKLFVDLWRKCYYEDNAYTVNAQIAEFLGQALAPVGGIQPIVDLRYPSYCKPSVKAPESQDREPSTIKTYLLCVTYQLLDRSYLVYLCIVFQVDTRSMEELLGTLELSTLRLAEGDWHWPEEDKKFHVAPWWKLIEAIKPAALKNMRASSIPVTDNEWPAGYYDWKIGLPDDDGIDLVDLS